MRVDDGEIVTRGQGTVKSEEKTKRAPGMETGAVHGTDENKVRASLRKDKNKRLSTFLQAAMGRGVAAMSVDGAAMSCNGSAMRCDVGGDRLRCGGDERR